MHHAVTVPVSGHVRCRWASIVGNCGAIAAPNAAEPDEDRPPAPRRRRAMPTAITVAATTLTHSTRRSRCRSPRHVMNSRPTRNPPQNVAVNAVPHPQPRSSSSAYVATHPAKHTSSPT